MRLVTALPPKALALVLALCSITVGQESNSVEQQATGLKRAEAALPVAEAKQRYLESQKHLEELAKGGWAREQVLEQRVARLDVTRVQEPRDRLRAAVAEAYDARRQLRQSELAELERRIANIKRALAISDAMKETIIDQRTDELFDRIEDGDKSGKREGASRKYPGATDGAVSPPPGSGSAKASALEIIDAQIDVKAAEANLAGAKRAHDYSKKMHAKGFVTGLDVESNASSYERAKLELERARLKLKSLGGTLPDDEPVSDKERSDGIARDAEKSRRLAELDVEEAEADFAAAERDYLRVSAAHESGTVTQELFHKAENKCRHAKIELERARLKLEAFGEPASGDKPLVDGKSTSLDRGRERLPDDQPSGFKGLSKAIARNAEKNWQLAELDVQEAEENLDAAAREFRRTEKLHATGAIAQEVFDKADQQYKHAKHELVRARMRLKALGDRPTSGDQASKNDSASHDPNTDDKSKEGIVWGRPAGSLQLGWNIEPRKEAYGLGDVLTVILLIRNAGAQATELTIPRIEVPERLGLDLVLHEASPDGAKLSWRWGPAHQKSREISGAFGIKLKPGGIHQLPSFLVSVGQTAGVGSANSLMAELLGAKPGQAARLSFKLSSSYDAQQAAELQSEPFVFRVEDADAGR